MSVSKYHVSGSDPSTPLSKSTEGSSLPPVLFKKHFYVHAKTMNFIDDFVTYHKYLKIGEPVIIIKPTVLCFNVVMPLLANSINPDQSSLIWSALFAQTYLYHYIEFLQNFALFLTGPDGHLYAFRARKAYKFNANGVGIERGFPKLTRKVFQKGPNYIGAAVYDRYRRKFYMFKGTKPDLLVRKC